MSRAATWAGAAGAAGLGWVAGCLLLFGTPITAVALVLLAALVAPWGRLARARIAGAVLWLMAAAAGWWVPLFEYQDRVDALAAKRDAGGPAALSTRDLAGIWVLNVGMAAGGLLVGFPEVALETLLLAVPGPKERVFHSGFAMGSRKVRDAVAALRPGEVRHVTFTYSDHPEARVGLALNPVDIAATCQDGRLALVGRVPVDYPPRARLPLFRARGRQIAIDEGLFDALEQRGWLFPYTAAWHWTVDSARCAPG